MTFLHALILGLVQGLTEFLPVSSSGHLVIVPDLLGWPEPSTSFDVVLHLGTMVAVVAYFWRDIVEILAAFLPGPDRAASETAVETVEEGTLDGGTRRPGATRSQRQSPRSRAAARRRGPQRQKRATLDAEMPAGKTALRRLGVLILIGSIPAGLAGAALQSKFEEVFNMPSEVAAFLIVTGIILFASEKLAQRQRHIEQLTVTDSLLIGASQAVAILPGISRSGSTISTGLFRGLTREAAARYSFLLSIPIIAGAAVLKLRHGFSGGEGEGGAALAAGFILSAVSGFAAIRFLLGFVRRHNLRIFAYYCWAAGAFVLVFKLVG